MKARIFTTEDADGNELVVKFVKPNQATMSKGDFVYREFFSKAIRAGFITNAEATKILRERQIWTTETEDELIQTRAQLESLQRELSSVDDKEVGMEVYAKIKRLREELQDISGARSSIMDNTAEAAAAEMRTQFFAANCVYHNNSNKRVFSNLDDFLKRLDEKVAIDSYRQALISNYEQALGINVPDGFAPELPEDKWLIELAQKEEAEAKAKEKPVTKKKRTRKKKIS